MNKKKLEILACAWEADIAHALKEIPYPLFQSKSRVVQQLADDGFLEYIEFNDRGIRLSGYHITHLGIMTYCENLPAEEGVEQQGKGDAGE